VPIEYCAETGIYLLAGETFSYALAVDHDPVAGASAVPHVHWGARVTLDDARELRQRLPNHARPSGTWSHPRAHLEEYVAHGGYRHDEPALVVEFDDGVRSLELCVRTAELDGDELTVELADRAYPLRITLRYRVDPAYDTLVRSAEIHNDSSDPIVVHQAASASWAPPPRTGYRLTTLSGGYAAETHLRRRPVEIGRVVLESRTGITGHENQSWLALDVDAGEEHGEVWSTALLWSGSWRATVQALLDGGVHVTIGVGGDQPHRLAPGESLGLPDTIGVYAMDGHGAMSRKWQAYERDRVLPDPERLRPVLYNSWEATYFDVTAAGQLELARRARDLGVELFVLDDGWFRPNDDDRAGLGDWHPVPRRFPNGLAELAGQIKDLGLLFGLWVEPEMVNVDSDLYRAHPDWIHRWPTRKPTQARHQYLLDFGRADVRDWAVTTLDGLVADLGLDYLKWDMNRAMAEPYSATGRNPWVDQVRGVDDVIDRLRARHPGLLIESCASGGGRADLAILTRTHWVWPSDNTDALDRLFIQDGYTYAHSAMSMACWVTDCPGSLSGRSTPLEFRFHTAMCGVLGIGGDLASWSDEDLAAARELIGTYKQIRPLVQRGRQFRLGSPRTDETFGVAYVSDDGADAAVFAFAPHVRHAAVGQVLPVRGLDPDASYQDVDTGATYSANALRYRGLRLDLHGDYGSRLIRLRRVPG
jgi:alpha-galactosidase